MAKNITKIEALPKLGNFPATPAKKKRVAAYARVSTDHDEQLTSFEAQKPELFYNIIAEHDAVFIREAANQPVGLC